MFSLCCEHVAGMAGRGVVSRRCACGAARDLGQLAEVRSVWTSDASCELAGHPQHAWHIHYGAVQNEYMRLEPTEKNEIGENKEQFARAYDVALSSHPCSKGVISSLWGA